MSGDSDESQELEWRRLDGVIDSSSDLVGAIAGGAIGLVGGPIGAMGGAAAGVVVSKAIRRVGLEVYDRLIVPRQQERIGATLAIALAEAETNQEHGDSVRDDGFFDAQIPGQRSDADEIMEGILLQATNTYEEKKLRHIGAMLPNLAVRPEVSAADGHWLVRLGDRLSWRQFLIISCFPAPPEQRLDLMNYPEMGSFLATPPASTSRLSQGLREEVDELGTLGLLGITNTDGEVVRARGTLDTMASIWGAPLSRWALTSQGRLLFEIARLDDVPLDERQVVLDELSAGPDDAGTTEPDVP